MVGQPVYLYGDGPTAVRRADGPPGTGQGRHVPCSPTGPGLR